MDKKLDSVIDYFAVFGYFPSFEDVYTFFPEKVDKKTLKKAFEAKKYTPLEYSVRKSNNETMKQWNNPNNRKQISKSKLNSSRFKLYIKLLSMFPQIKLVGLSGSISMMNADENDDIDLFIITAKNRLFTGRFIALVLAQVFGLRRNREANNETMEQSNNDFRNKVCLNLFFDESNLRVPKFKQTLFVGHEVLQMKPIVIKGDIYERFLGANDWVLKLFPNAPRVIPARAGIQTKSTGSPTRSGMTGIIEYYLKNFQLRLIKKHKTTEIITATQLWFHPDDFEKKLKTVENS